MKKTSSEIILNEELKTFKWNEVDEYPSFSECDSSLSKAQKKQCFESILTKHITSHIAKDPIIVSEDINDTIIVHFQISEKGSIKIKEIIKSNLIEKQIPNIDSLLFTSITELQQIFPALKRGQQVKTEFKLPVIIQVN